MNKNELDTICSKKNAAIIAPAGHGKTEMIVELVKHLPGRQLLLTHTNAGVDALQKRLRKHNIPNNQYAIFTIAGFCMRWCDSFPVTAEIKNISMQDKNFYPMYHRGIIKILENDWAKKILRNSYGSVIVDEYQDCLQEQHEIFLMMNEVLPVYVLGDPLQAIFGWAGKLVSWKNIGFEMIHVETFPWRWHETNLELGEYLQEIRKQLLPALDGNDVTVATQNFGYSVQIISTANKMDYRFLAELQKYNSVLYITKWARDQVSYCQNTGGLFQNDEPQSLNELFSFAKIMDNNDGYTIGLELFNIFRSCATRVNEELGTFQKHLHEGNVDFARIKKYPEFGKLLSIVIEKHRYQDILKIMEWFKSNSAFRIYRKELYLEAMRAINCAIIYGISVMEAAQRIRMMPGQQKRYSDFKLLSSRTVLSKGLEYECVVVDLSQAIKHGSEFNATDYYVAMTRAMKKIYLITDYDTVRLKAQTT